MITAEQQIVVIAYLASKLNTGEEWFATPNEAFFGKSPQEIVLEGDGDLVIQFLEVRLGLRKGAAF